jgi:phage shock protein E
LSLPVDPAIVAVVAGAAAILVLRRLLGAGRAPASVVREKLAAGAVVVDVRTPGEFRSGAHPRALNIPLQELRGRLAEIPTQRPVVVYCATGMRSGTAARVLRAAGFPDVVNAGGLRAMPAE